MKSSDIRVGKNLHAVEVNVTQEGLVEATYQNLTVEGINAPSIRGPLTRCRKLLGSQFVSYSFCTKTGVRGQRKYGLNFSYEFLTWEFFRKDGLMRLFLTPTAAHRYVNRLNAQRLTPTEAAITERRAYYRNNPRPGRR